MDQLHEPTARKPRGRPRTRTPAKRMLSGRGVTLKSQLREKVIKVRDYFQKEKANNGPLLSVHKVLQRTADALDIHPSSVKRITKEKSSSINAGGESILTTPGKTRARKPPITGLDTFQEDAIRRHIHDYYKRKEYPTLRKLKQSLEQNELFTGSLSSIRIIMKKIGFTYKKFSGRKVVLERLDVAAARCRFLREIKGQDFDKIVWLDETWVNAGHCRKQGWTDDTIHGTMPTPVGKGERLILAHAGSSKGFVENSLLMFKSKKTGDYHEEMDHDKFYTWCSDVLVKNLSKDAVIVMDNAPYHSKQIDKAPTSKNNKKEITEWLNRKGATFSTDMKKCELLEVAKLYKPNNITYFVDELFKRNGHKVIRLPPYHCHFNAIELIWAQIKGHVAENNKAFTITSVSKLVEEALGKTTSDCWKKVVDHTQKIIDDAWTNEGLLEEAVERLVIPLGDSSSSEDSESEEDGQFNSDHEDDDQAMLGCRPLLFEEY